MFISQLKVNDLVSIHFPETKANTSYTEYAIVIKVDDNNEQLRLDH